MDLTLADHVHIYMGQSTSEDDWNDRCDAVKKANNGYPDFWYSVVVMSGLMAETRHEWTICN